MTSISHRYADLSSLDPDGEPPDAETLERVEDQKLQSFEEGYQAGWTDAESNFETEKKNVTNEILDTLRDLSFTYQDALSRLNQSLHPLFQQLMVSLLPRTASAALRAHVIEQLVEMAASQTSGQITLRVSDSDFPMLEEVLDGVELKLPIALKADKALRPQQLFVALDMVEREVNLDLVSQEITDAMHAFNFHSQLEHFAD
ncbi:FliH/SctL family protein [Sulfitobacter guttiformis]|uniref:Flagellar assembly protein FliH n=1 Tax=Sulfitobacter guttiformis TaxID=74349 RepID=A0A420DS72_9RHOB|nr:hypothetical protein [Sulfitobacter guttiformis]KIN74584.1 ABC transporter, ATP-binding protein [Sulfitobacter guttiformis KCTC 32187]RKE97164.1 flagellar assembly protein FliH [Sulfitobacter guttiformis]